MVRRPLEKVVEGGRVILTWTVTKEFTAVSGDMALTVIDRLGLRHDVRRRCLHVLDGFVPQSLGLVFGGDGGGLYHRHLVSAESARQAAASAEGAAGSASTAGDIRDETETIKFETEKILENTINIEHAIKMLAEKAQQFAGLAQQYADMASQIAYGQKGYYRTPEALQAAYPEGQDGWWAVVGTTDTIWVWDSDSGAWVDSRQGTDMTNYPQWAQLANKLMVPCTCAYNAETHIFSLTRKDISQMLQDGAGDCGLAGPAGGQDVGGAGGDRSAAGIVAGGIKRVRAALILKTEKLGVLM